MFVAKVKPKKFFKKDAKDVPPYCKVIVINYLKRYTIIKKNCIIHTLSELGGP